MHLLNAWFVMHRHLKKIAILVFKLLLAVKFKLARGFFLISGRFDNSAILFGEKNGLEARDNAFALFASMFDAGRRDVFYLVSRRCIDVDATRRFGTNIIRYNSLRHLLYIFRARLLVVNDGFRDVYPNVAGILGRTDTPFLYVQHGILRYKRVHFTAGHYLGRILRFVISTDFEVDIMTDKILSAPNDRERVELDYVRTLMGRRKPINSRDDLRDFAKSLRTAAKKLANPVFAARLVKQAKQAEHIANRVGMPRARLIQSGLPRHDKLAALNPQKRNHEVSIFFTYREKWVKGGAKAPFVERIAEILENEHVQAVAEQYGLTFKVYLHHKQRNFTEHLKMRLPNNVVFDETGDISKQMNVCGAVISDYSSVVFDFCLAGCPVIFYHPDYLAYQAERGDFTETEADWIGPIARDASELASHLAATFESTQEALSYRNKLLKAYPNWGNALPALVKAVDEIPPRVVFVCYNIYGIGGTVRSTINSANYLHRLGYQVEIISLRQSSLETTLNLDPAIRIRPLLPSFRGRKPHSIIDRLISKIPSILFDKNEDSYRHINLLIDIRLAKTLRSITADVVIPTIPSLGRAAVWFCRKKTAVLIQEHKFYAAHKPSVQKLITKYYKRADGLLTLTELDRVEYQATTGVPAFVVPNGVEPSFEGSLPVTRPRIIALGRLDTQKQFDLLITAFKAVADRHPTWELHIFGQGSHQGDLEALICNLGLSERAFMRGPTANGSEEMARSEICAVSSSFEGFGMTFIEAYAAGKPVITFDIERGPKEIVIDGVTGLKAEAFDVADYAQKLDRLMSDDGLRAELGHNAKSMWSRRYRMDVTGKHLEEAISAMVRR